MLKKRHLFLIMLICLFAVSAVSAADNATGDILAMEETTDEVVGIEENQVINQTYDDIGVGDETFTALQNKTDTTSVYGASAGGTFSDIQDLINNAGSGDVIVLDGYYSGSGSPISVNNEVTIVGTEGTVLDAKGSSNILEVYANNVRIENINFINGQESWGGAIYWSGDSGVLINSTFSDNHASWGGAIFWWASDGYLSDCLFENNTAQNYGGAIYVNGRNLRMLSSRYINNAVTNTLTNWQGGGAIYLDLTPVDAVDYHIIANSTFISNKAIYSYGGAIKLGTGLARFDSNEFYDNFAVKGTSIILGDVTRAINNRFYLNSIDEIPSCVEEGNLSTIFDLNTFYVNGKIISKNSYFNNETTYDTFLTANIVDNNGDRKLIISLRDIDDDPVVGADVFVILGNVGYSLVTGSDGQASVSTIDLAAGQYTAVIFYGGNNIYGSASATLTFSVDKIDTILTVPDAVAVYNVGGAVVATLKDSYGNVVQGVNVKIVAGNLSITAKTDAKGQVSLDISDLAPGEYVISARSSAKSAIYNEATATANAIVYADKLDTALTIPDVVVVGDSSAVVVATLKDSYGNLVSGINVNIAVGNLSKTAKSNKNGQVSLDISGLAPGEYVISARSSAKSLIYNEATATAKAILSEDKIDTTLTIPNVVVVGNSAGVVVATLKDSYGNVVSDVNVRIVVGNLSIIEKTDAKGQVSLDISDLAPGEYVISAKSSAKTAFYNEAKATAKAFVSEDKIDTTLTVPDTIAIYKGSGVVVATLKDSYGNLVSDVNVKIVVGNLSITAKTDVNGQVSLDISGLAPGEYVISARSSARSAIYNESKATANAIVYADKLDTTLTIPDVVVVGDSSAVVVATLKDSYGNLVSGIYVNIVLGNLSKTAKTDVNGQVSLDISGLAPGEYVISAKSSAKSPIYNQATTTAKAIVSEDKIDTTLTIPNVFVVGNSTGVVIATLKDSYGNVVSGINVNIAVGGLSKTAKTDVNGQVSLDISGLAPGEYVISARSSARSAIYNESKVTAKAFVSEDKIDTTLSIPDTIAIYKGSGIVVATLKDSYGNVVSDVNVRIVVGNLSIIEKTDAKGQVSLDISDLAPGEYVISARSSAKTAFYNEAKATANAIVYADKLDTTLIMHDVVVVGDSPAVVVATLKDSYGNLVSGINVNIAVGNLSKTAKTDVNGQVSLDISGLAPGEYVISARSSARSPIYNEAKATANAIVSEDKIDTTLTIPNAIAIYKGSGIVVATLKDSYGNVVSGVNVRIVVGNLSIIEKTDAKGQVSLDISDLAPGEYVISARSSAKTAFYNEAKATAKAFVSEDKIDTTLTVPDTIAIYKGSGIVVATLKDSYGNLVSDVNVKIVAGNLSITAKTDAKGQVSLDISDLAPGEYVISARSSARSAIYNEATATANAIVYADKLDTTLTIPDMIVDINSPAVVVATLKDSYGNVVSGIYVNIVLGNLSKTAKTDVNGQVSLDISGLAPGEYMISARSSAKSPIYKEARTTANVIVSKGLSQLTADDLCIDYGKNATLVITLEDIYGNAIDNAIIYAYTSYNETYGFITDDEGKAYLPINNLELGSYSIYINFEGDDSYLESNAVANILVNKAHSEWDLNGFDQFHYGEQDYLSATLKDINGNPIPNVSTTVTFVKAYTSEYYVSYTCVTNNAGIIYINTKDLDVNDYFVNYNFAGNSYYESSSGYHSISVIKCPTHFVIDNGFNSANYQENKWWSIKLIKYYEIFDYTGDGIGNADVKITFTEKSTQRQYVFNLKTSSNSQDYGYAKLNTKDMLPGVYSITVDYFGDSNYLENHRYYDYYNHMTDYSTLTINKGNPTITTTGVTTTYGVEGFVTATLKDPNGNVMANRLVTFTFEDGTGRTVRTDSNGKAKLSTLGVNAGTHTITVTYAPESGSDDYSKYNSVSSSATMKINKDIAVVYVKDSAGVWIIDKSGNPVKSYYYVNAAVHADIVVYVENTNGDLIEGVHVRSYPDILVTNNKGSVTFDFYSYYSGPYDLHIDLLGDDNYYIHRLVDNYYYSDQIIVPIWVR